MGADKKVFHVSPRSLADCFHAAPSIGIPRAQPRASSRGTSIRSCRSAPSMAPTSPTDRARMGPTSRPFEDGLAKFGKDGCLVSIDMLQSNKIAVQTARAARRPSKRRGDQTVRKRHSAMPDPSSPRPRFPPSPRFPRQRRAWPRRRHARRRNPARRRPRRRTRRKGSHQAPRAAPRQDRAAIRPAPPEPLPPGERVGFAVVGTGTPRAGGDHPGVRLVEKKPKLAAVVSGDRAKAAKSSPREHGLPDAGIYDYQTYDQLRDNKNVDVIYIVLPNGTCTPNTPCAARRRASTSSAKSPWPTASPSASR